MATKKLIGSSNCAGANRTSSSFEGLLSAAALPFTPLSSGKLFTNLGTDTMASTLASMNRVIAKSGSRFR
jgi:hypothetical protein